MKHVLTFILLTLLVTSTKALHAQAPTISLVPSAENLSVGDTLELDVLLSDFEEMLSMQFGITWDPEVLRFLSFKHLNGPDFPDFTQDNVAGPIHGDIPEGTLGVSWHHPFFIPTSVEDGTRLFRVRLLALRCSGTHIELGAGSTPGVELLNANAQNVGMNTVNSTVTVSTEDCQGSIPGLLWLDVSNSVSYRGLSNCVRVNTQSGFERIEHLAFELEGIGGSVLHFDSVASVLGDVFRAEHVSLQPDGRVSVDWAADSAVSLPSGTVLFELCFTGQAPGSYWMGLSESAAPTVLQQDNQVPMGLEVDSGHIRVFAYVSNSALEMEIGNVEDIIVGDTVSVPIWVRGFSDINHLQCQISYSGQRLRLLGVESEEALLPGLSIDASQNGRLEINYLNEHGQGADLPDGHQLLMLRFEAVQNGNAWLAFQGSTEVTVRSGGYIPFEGADADLHVLCYHPDLRAMMTIYESMNGDEWERNDGWRDVASEGNCDPCNWYGVICNAEGRVACIDLDGIPDCGSIRRDGNALSGVLPEEIGELFFLERLFLRGNQNLTGSLPSSLGNLTQLQQLDLEHTGLSGPIPAELGNLTQLEELYLGKGPLSGSIPDELSQLTQLKRLRLSNANLSGSLPGWLGELSLLEELDFSGNQLSGCFPAEINALCERAEQLALQGSKGFTTEGNPELPWKGDLLRFCQAEAQIGAPCGPAASLGQQILEDCSCGFPADMPVDLPSEIGPGIAPNPSNGEFRVLLPLWHQDMQVRVMDLQGRVILHRQAHSGDTFDLNGQPAGLYVVEVRTEGQVWVKKLSLTR